MTTVSEIFETMDYGPAPESSAPAIEWLEEHGRQFGLFIGGRWIDSQSGESFETINPATTEPLARIAQAGKADVDLARSRFDGSAHLAEPLGKWVQPRRESRRYCNNGDAGAVQRFERRGREGMVDTHRGDLDI